MCPLRGMLRRQAGEAGETLLGDPKIGWWVGKPDVHELLKTQPLVEVYQWDDWSIFSTDGEV